MTIATADLVDCIRANAYNLVPGSITVYQDTVTFQVRELAIHDITAGIIGGVIVDTTDGDELYFTLNEYATFLRGEK